MERKKEWAANIAAGVIIVLAARLSMVPSRCWVPEFRVAAAAVARLLDNTNNTMYAKDKYFSFSLSLSLSFFSLLQFLYSPNSFYGTRKSHVLEQREQGITSWTVQG